MKKIILIFSLILIVSCDQDPEFDYKQDYILEAFLLVDEPIKEVRLTRTLPLTETYSFEAASIRDAEVIIRQDSLDFPLTFNPRTLKYEFDDEYLVLPETRYDIEINFQDDSRITGTTLTPKRLLWDTVFQEKVFQFPIDSLNPDITERISWIYPDELQSFNLTVLCLDTLEYGAYFDDFGIGSSTDELNRRINRPWRIDFDFLDPVEFAILPGTTKSTPVVWSAFKFYGLHEVAVFAPDFNWSLWSLQFYRQQYFDQLSTISGDGLGVFGSGSAVRDTFFVLKNQP